MADNRATALWRPELAPGGGAAAPHHGRQAAASAKLEQAPALQGGFAAQAPLREPTHAWLGKSRAGAKSAKTCLGSGVNHGGVVWPFPRAYLFPLPRAHCAVLRRALF